MVRRKIIVVDSCKECPFSHSTFSFIGICKKISSDNEIPGMVYMHGLIWDRCPLDDAGGFL